MARPTSWIQCRSLFAKRKEPRSPCIVFVKQDLPHDYFDQRGRILIEHVYAITQDITSEHNIVTFLPRNLLEQFRQIANMCVSSSSFLSAE